MLPASRGHGKHLALLTALGAGPASRMRRAGLLVAMLVLAGCASRPAPGPGADPPAALVVAFSDGFHSGVLLPREDVPPRLLPPAPAADAWAVVHFGERRWILGLADSCGDGLRLGLTSGDGGVEVDVVPWWRHDRGGTDPENLRTWVFPVSRAELAAVIARLEAWAPAGLPGGRIGPTTSWWESPRRWRLGCNCHDFTADLLWAGGIEVAVGPVMTAGRMHRALDRAWELRDASR